MQVRDGMSEVSLTVGPTHTLREAAAMMVEKGTGAALVSDAESPAPGIVTERDLLISVGAGEDPDAELVADHMSEQRDRRRTGLEPGARRGGDVAPRRPPPGRLRRMPSWSACSRCATSSASGPATARPRA